MSSLAVLPIARARVLTLMLAVVAATIFGGSLQLLLWWHQDRTFAQGLIEHPWAWLFYAWLGIPIAAEHLWRILGAERRAYPKVHSGLN